MRPTSHDASLILGASLLIRSASANPLSPTSTSFPSASPTLPPHQQPQYCTNAWSTTETTISKPGWYGPTLMTLIASRTVTTLEQVATAYPATLTDTLVSTVTYEYHMTYSDHHSSDSFSCAVYTIPFNTRVVTVAPATVKPCGAGLMESGTVSAGKSLECVKMYP
jgi:hypothetical protein